MDPSERDHFIDLESGEGLIDGGEAPSKKRSCGGGDEKGAVLLAAEEEEERKVKKGSGKKPPRPPKSASLDAVDAKILREISEQVMMKRARMERMRALRIRKNGVRQRSNDGNLCALLTTVVFCIVIIWQGFFARGISSVTYQGSPQSSMGPSGGLISVQFYRNISTDVPHGSNSASPNNVEQVSGLDGHGETRRILG